MGDSLEMTSHIQPLSASGDPVPTSVSEFFSFFLTVTFWGQKPTAIGDGEQEIGRTMHSLILACLYFSSKM